MIQKYVNEIIVKGVFVKHLLKNAARGVHSEFVIQVLSRLTLENNGLDGWISSTPGTCTNFASPPAIDLGGFVTLIDFVVTEEMASSYSIGHLKHSENRSNLFLGSCIMEFSKIHILDKGFRFRISTSKIIKTASCIMAGL